MRPIPQSRHGERISSTTRCIRHKVLFTKTLRRAALYKISRMSFQPDLRGTGCPEPDPGAANPAESRKGRRRSAGRVIPPASESHNLYSGNADSFGEVLIENPERRSRWEQLHSLIYFGAGLKPAEAAFLFGRDEGTIAGWEARQRAPAAVWRALLAMAGDLGAVDKAFAGWTLISGKLYCADLADGWAPGEIRALPYLRGAMESYHAERQAARAAARKLESESGGETPPRPPATLSRDTRSASWKLESESGGETPPRPPATLSGDTRCAGKNAGSGAGRAPPRWRGDPSHRRRFPPCRRGRWEAPHVGPRRSYADEPPRRHQRPASGGVRQRQRSAGKGRGRRPGDAQAFGHAVGGVTGPVRSARGLARTGAHRSRCARAGGSPGGRRRRAPWNWPRSRSRAGRLKNAPWRDNS